MTRTSLALPALVIAVCCNAPSAGAQADRYPSMASVGQYQMDRGAALVRRHGSGYAQGVSGAAFGCADTRETPS